MCAARTPSRIAVVDEHGQLTYEELEHESSRLAARLQEAGAGPERCVGIFLPRSRGFVVAALAVLRSGAAYVPVDPSTPSDRVSFILADAGVLAVVSEPRVARDLPGGSWPVIETESAGSKLATPLLDIEENRDTLAYIVYTSGSTGQPKGVEITRANLRNLVEWHQSAFAVTATDRASQLAGLGFDAAGWEIWPYLTAGASLHIADETTRRSPPMLRDWIVAKKITIGFVPTFLAEQLFDADWPDETVLRLLLTGGDRLERRPLAGLPFTVVNNYGPTECTVVATSGPVFPEEGNAGLPSIGRPITNATALILNDALRPVTPGEAGELCIGGALVGRGYRNLPELNASRFVTYIAAPGEPLRIYRTGDRVRTLGNGEIEFLGRFDDQVKIRGYRVELGEIVACLNRYPSVESSAVIVSDAYAGGPALVAYVVPSAGARLTESELRAYLATKLPDYMIPTCFALMSALPVTTNGKLDKSALPAPGADNHLPAAT
ncbi:MAG: amino acid adenylation domain-containing protein, partial [Candidatus Cybelea sp.]